MAELSLCEGDQLICVFNYVVSSLINIMHNELEIQNCLSYSKENVKLDMQF